MTLSEEAAELATEIANLVEKCRLISLKGEALGARILKEHPEAADSVSASLDSIRSAMAKLTNSLQ